MIYDREKVIAWLDAHCDWELNRCFNLPDQVKYVAWSDRTTHPHPTELEALRELVQYEGGSDAVERLFG